MDSMRPVAAFFRSCLYVCGLIANCERLMSARLHHTTFVRYSEFIGILIGDEDLDALEMTIEPVQKAADLASIEVEIAACMEMFLSRLVGSC